MLHLELPEPLDQLLLTLSSFVDARHRDLLEPLFLGTLLAHGRRTATSWFRAGDFVEDFRRGYTLLGALGRKHLDLFSSVLFHRLRQTIEPGDFWLFGIDDTPTKRYGPHVEGAGIHHNPTPGPANHAYLYGHVWVTLDWLVRHRDCHAMALPLSAQLYIRRDDIAQLDADRRPEFHTKLESAIDQIRWIKQQLSGSDKPIWVVVDGGYSKRPVMKVSKQEGVVLVGRLPCNASLWDLPKEVPSGQKKRGRPRIYGTNRLSLAKRAAHQQGWQEVECFQYQQRVRKQIKTFLATWRPAGGVIRVVIIKEETGWRAHYSTDPGASVVDILESVASRTSMEQTNKEVKEVEGAGQQQLRNREANEGAFHMCLWSYTAVEWWAWELELEELSQSSRGPWEVDARRVSHAEKRKALQQQCLREEFWRAWGSAPLPEKISQLVELLLEMAL